LSVTVDPGTLPALIALFTGCITFKATWLRPQVNSHHAVESLPVCHAAGAVNSKAGHFLL
jgi:hypothetical protein